MYAILKGIVDKFNYLFIIHSMNRNKKITRCFFGLLILLLTLCSTIDAADSILVRIRTDVYSVKLHIDDSLYVQDNFGNQFSSNNWFIISLTSGEHHISLQFEDERIDTTIVITQQESIALEFSFLPEEIIDNASKIFIMSNPDSGYITIDGKVLEILTPTFVSLDKDTVSVEVYRDGYEPLVTDLMLAELQKKQVNFILRPMAPVHLIADSLGYSFDKLTPLIDIRVAEMVREKYMGMAETFMIFPFAQGLIAKLALDDENQTEANVMVGAGVVLSVGSYLLSKILSKKKKNKIDETNKDIEQRNLLIKDSNKQIELLVRKINAERIIQWQEENRNNGTVIITDRK